MSDRPADAAPPKLVPHILGHATGADGKILCHAEGEDGVMSGVILFARRGKVVLKFPDQWLTDALFDEWTASAKDGAPWAALEISVEGGRAVSRRFRPEDYVAPPLEARIPHLVKAHFGASEWDDSDPAPGHSAKPWWRFW
jgi:hypothetical protein